MKTKGKWKLKKINNLFNNNQFNNVNYILNY
jgi:hypothetical protein